MIIAHRDVHGRKRKRLGEVDQFQRQLSFSTGGSTAESTPKPNSFIEVRLRDETNPCENARVEKQWGFQSAAEMCKLHRTELTDEFARRSTVSRNDGERAETSSDVHRDLIMASHVHPDQIAHVTEDSISGLSALKKMIKERIIFPIQRPDLHVGLYRPPGGLLLMGPPGTGKTLLAKWIASEARATFFNVSVATLQSLWSGEGEKIIECLFHVANEHAPSIIFMDEIDGLLGQRSTRDASHTTSFKNQLLQGMDGLLSSKSHKPVIVLGATNRPEAMDEAALRRFDHRVLVPLPDGESAGNQIRLHLEAHRQEIKCECASMQWIEGFVKKGKLGGFNGSDIRTLCGVAANLVYDRVMMQYGSDLTKVPGPHIFGLPGLAEFEEAVGRMKPIPSETKDWTRFLSGE